MGFKRLQVGGLRGFAQMGSVTLAEPNGSTGSGITALVGANNAGKSTLVEALAAIARGGSLPSFHSGARNATFGDRVEIRLERTDGVDRALDSIAAGSSETIRSGPPLAPGEVLTIPARRSFDPFFSQSNGSNRGYADVYQWPAQRARNIPGFEGRLFKLQRDAEARAQFDELFHRVIGRKLHWTIDQSEQGMYFLKISAGQGRASHSSDGLGEGLVSLLFIVDALYDSTSDSLIVIDEPELSLHPQYQRRLRGLIAELAADRQIVYATHSPYFVDWDDVAAGAAVARIYASEAGTQIAQPGRAVLDAVARSRLDGHNPHALGLQASEVFFLEDRIILVEGQEDVLLLPEVLRQAGVALNGAIYGWGVGGADKMPQIVELLAAMGYRHVVGVLDRDKRAVADGLRSAYPEYRFVTIPADDIRDKPAVAAKPRKTGLLDSARMIHPDALAETQLTLRSIVAYLDS